MAPTQAPALDPFEIRRQLAKKKLSWFVRESWPILEPTTRLVWNWHMEAMCDHIQAMLEGWIKSQKTGIQYPVRNLLTTVPPGSSKSRVTSVCAVAWMWGHFPSSRFLCFSSNPRVSIRDSMFCREIIKSEWYKAVFKPEWKIAEDQDAKGNYRNDAGGSRVAIGVGAKLLGERGDFIIVDDPHGSYEDVQSDLIRQGVLDWWDQIACNRLNNMVLGMRFGVMQRLHEDDWAGHILKSGEWEHLCIPMEYVPGHRKMVPEKTETEIKIKWVNEPTWLGWRDPRTLPGELLCPKRWTPEVLVAEKIRLRDAGYSGQNQQDPAAAEGNLFKEAWFRYYIDGGDHYVLGTANGERIVSKKRIKRRFQTADFAFSTKESADYTVISTWDLTWANELILVHVRRGKWEDPDVEQILEADYALFRPFYVAIEKKQNGATILQRLGRHNRLRTRELLADVDKMTRARTAIVDMSNGIIFFPKNADWLEDCKKELKIFPNGSHDDFVDTLSYAVIEKSSALSRILDYGRIANPHSPDQGARNGENQISESVSNAPVEV